MLTGDSFANDTQITSQLIKTCMDVREEAPINGSFLVLDLDEEGFELMRRVPKSHEAGKSSTAFECVQATQEVFQKQQVGRLGRPLVDVFLKALEYLIRLFEEDLDDLLIKIFRQEFCQRWIPFNLSGFFRGCRRLLGR